MTEAEWLVCTTLHTMWCHVRGKASERKLRLFVCASCQRVRHLLPSELASDVVSLLEPFAEGLIRITEGTTARQLARLQARSKAIQRTGYLPWAVRHAAEALYYAASENVERAVSSVGCALSALVAERTGGHGLNSRIQPPEMQQFANILRDLFGNPFQNAQMTDRWKTRSVIEIAQTTYEAGVFDHLPILADALEEAGCDDANILDHCRKPGEHVRGCWVLDLILGRT